MACKNGMYAPSGNPLGDAYHLAGMAFCHAAGLRCNNFLKFTNALANARRVWRYPMQPGETMKEAEAAWSPLSAW